MKTIRLAILVILVIQVLVSAGVWADNGDFSTYCALDKTASVKYTLYSNECFIDDALVSGVNGSDWSANWAVTTSSDGNVSQYGIISFKETVLDALYLRVMCDGIDLKHRTSSYRNRGPASSNSAMNVSAFPEASSFVAPAMGIALNVAGITGYIRRRRV